MVCLDGERSSIQVLRGNTEEPTPLPDTLSQSLSTSSHGTRVCDWQTQWDALLPAHPPG